MLGRRPAPRQRRRQDSDLNDPDDDNDTLPDTSDPFAVDADNGKTTSLPVSYTWDNDAPNPGGLLNLGFTGLMTNKSSNYDTLYDPANMTAGGAAGVVTVDKVPEGDACQDHEHAEVRLPVRRQRHPPPPASSPPTPG